MKYYTYARLFPALLTSIPFILFYYFNVGTEINKFLSFAWSVPIVANVTVSLAIIYALIQLNRFLSKEIFQRLYFQDEIDMPTTRYLLWRDNFFPEEIKSKMRNKLKNDFDIDLLTKELELQDEHKARKLNIFAVSQIRNKLRGNKMLLRHNIEYGFVRNFLGGCIIALLMSLTNTFLFKYSYISDEAFKISVVLNVLYFIPILVSKIVLKKFGHYYAKILFEQYVD